MSATRTATKSIIYLLLSVYAVILIYPVFWMATSALKVPREIFGSPFSLPANPRWGNFKIVWDQGMWRYLLNSVLVTAVAVVLIVIIAAMAAYALARLRFRARTGIYLLIIAGYAIPIHTVLVPLYMTLDRLGILNSYLGLIGPYVAFGVPFAVLLLYAFFLEFPKELEEAAFLDGCNTWQGLFHVVLPLSLPGMVSVAIFEANFVWNEFLLALIVIRDQELKTLPRSISDYQGQWTTNWPLLLTTLTVAVVPMLLIYIILQRQFINSLAGYSK
jgi:multiple sugar transport system permease protein/raffinose/stachyose/melibiose transport system permease protein